MTKITDESVLRSSSDEPASNPAMGWAFLTVAFGLDVYLRKPISEGQIKRELEREARSAH